MTGTEVYLSQCELNKTTKQIELLFQINLIICTSRAQLREMQSSLKCYIYTALKTVQV